MELELITDPVENAFTIEMPRGWNNRAWLERRGPAAHQLALSTSPDGATALFMGDARLPFFVDPSSTPFPPPGSVLQPFMSIEHFLPGYAQDRFSTLPGFRPLRMEPAPELYRACAEKVAGSGGHGAWITAGRFFFTYADSGRPVNGALYGSTTRLGVMWWADIMGLTTSGDPAAFEGLMMHLYRSRRVTPQMHQQQMNERARNAAMHQATMAQLDNNAAILRSNHVNNMQNLHSMSAAHQQRMDNLHSSHDAANRAWNEQQASQFAAPPSSNDDSHRRFLNMIAEERTVIDGEGNTHQVTAGYDRYFRNRSDGTWIGTKNDRDLRGLAGVDPSLYDEVKIKI